VYIKKCGLRLHLKVAAQSVSLRIIKIHYKLPMLVNNKKLPVRYCSGRTFVFPLVAVTVVTIVLLGVVCCKAM